MHHTPPSSSRDGRDSKRRSEPTSSANVTAIRINGLDIPGGWARPLHDAFLCHAPPAAQLGDRVDVLLDVAQGGHVLAQGAVVAFGRGPKGRTARVTIERARIWGYKHHLRHVLQHALGIVSPDEASFSIASGGWQFDAAMAANVAKVQKPPAAKKSAAAPTPAAKERWTSVTGASVTNATPTVSHKGGEDSHGGVRVSTRVALQAKNRMAKGTAVRVSERRVDVVTRGLRLNAGDLVHVLFPVSVHIRTERVLLVCRVNSVERSMDDSDAVELSICRIADAGGSALWREHVEDERRMGGSGQVRVRRAVTDDPPKRNLG